MGELELAAAVIGARPFGIAVVAYLRSRCLDFGILGSPMSRYRTQMPAGAPCIAPRCLPPIRGIGFFPA